MTNVINNRVASFVRFILRALRLPFEAPAYVVENLKESWQWASDETKMAVRLTTYTVAGLFGFLMILWSIAVAATVYPMTMSYRDQMMTANHSIAMMFLLIGFSLIFAVAKSATSEREWGAELAIWSLMAVATAGLYPLLALFVPSTELSNTYTVIGLFIQSAWLVFCIIRVGIWIIQNTAEHGGLYIGINLPFGIVRMTQAEVDSLKRSRALWD